MNEQRTSEQRLSCQYCPARFLNEAEREEHEREAHRICSSEFGFAVKGTDKCNICGHPVSAHPAPTVALSSKQKVKRWVTTWPYHLQPTFGSSTIDWTKVEVVPAHSYDSAQAELERLRAALRRYGRHDSSGMPDEPELRCNATRMRGGPCTCGLDAALRGADETKACQFCERGDYRDANNVHWKNGHESGFCTVNKTSDV